MTFDILNLRLKGFEFHKRLLAGKEKWTRKNLGVVFEHWHQLRRFYPKDFRNLTYQAANELLVKGNAGMYFIGGFIVSQVDDSFKEDLGVFAFPELNPNWGTDSIDAPIDGYVLPAKACRGKEKMTEELIEHLGTVDAFRAYDQENPGFLGIMTLKDPVNPDGPPPSPAWQKKFWSASVSMES